MPVRLSPRCLSVETIAAIERPMGRAVCFVARRERSVARRSSKNASSSMVPSVLKSLSRSAWYACKTAMVCRAAPA
ncbi:hypothetical protein ROHU_015881 [Labeo rohita]|uniref:Uncharacterized protein n=1 Tax=Labeo rohita TaxID=84645 RepID=A0A498NM59_LABRO|nr:hypothetical protein ROHU_015881 [Labeo rohita]